MLTGAMLTGAMLAKRAKRNGKHAHDKRGHGTQLERRSRQPSARFAGCKKEKVPAADLPIGAEGTRESQAGVLPAK